MIVVKTYNINMRGKHRNGYSVKEFGVSSKTSFGILGHLGNGRLVVACYSLSFTYLILC